MAVVQTRRLGEIKRLVNLHHKGGELEIAIRKWRMEHGAVDPTPEALEFAIRLLKRQEERDVKHFHGSGLDRCLREQVLTVLGYKGDWALDTDRDAIFDDGKWRGLRWQMQLFMMGIIKDEFHAERIFRVKKWWVKGTVDAFGELNGKPVIIEIKGANDRQFEIVRSEGRPKQSYFWQVLVYLVLAEDLGVAVDRAIIFYENKNTQEMQEFNVYLRDYPKEAALVRRKYRYLNRARKMKKLPGFHCSLRETDMLFRQCAQAKNCVMLAEQGKFPQTPQNLLIFKKSKRKERTFRLKLS